MQSAPDLATIRAAAQQHQDELDRDLRFLTIAALARRWGMSKTSVRDIPFEDLPWRNLGRGLVRERRRYDPADVDRYEALLLEREKKRRRAV